MNLGTKSANFKQGRISVIDNLESSIATDSAANLSQPWQVAQLQSTQPQSRSGKKR